MRLTDEQFKALLPYQKHFETIVRSQWARHPGIAALDLMQEIYNEVSGTKMRLNKGCSNCISNLMSDLGKIFLADLEERNKTIVSKIDTDLEPVKVEVKVKKPRRTKRKE